MKNLFTKGPYIFSAIILFLGVTLTAKAQYSGTNLETTGLYTALAKDASNNIYVTRVKAATGGATYEVEKYINGAGTPIVIYSSLTHQLNNFPWGLAVDGSGNVYLSTDFSAGGGSVIKLKYGGGNSYIGSTYLSGRYFSALAFDASNNLYTAEYDALNHTYAVVKYAAGSPAHSTGTILYDNLKSGSLYACPTGLTVAANGDIYVADAFSKVSTFTDGGHIYKLTKASSYAATPVSTGNYASALAFDGAGNLYSTENRGSGYNLYEYANAAGAGVSLLNSFHTNGIYYPWGIAAYSAAEIFVADGDDGANGGALLQVHHTPPTVTTNPATIVFTSVATLNGLVNDNKNTTTVNFIYGTSPTLAGATTKAATTGGTINAGSGNTHVALNITGLTASTTYYYTVSATNPGGIIQGGILSFITRPTIAYISPVSYPAEITIAPLTPTHTAVPAPAYSAPVTIGSGFSDPFNIAVDASGNIYVTDLGNKALKKIPAAGGAPVTIATGFSSLTGVAVDVAGNVYVADEAANIVEKFIGGAGAPVSIGTGFINPYAVAVDVAGNVYVADGGNNAVKKILAADGSTVAIGSGFATPTGVAVDAAGNVYVADFGNNLVKEILAGAGTTVTIGTGFTSPVGVGVDAAGNVYVADYGNSTIQKIPAGGGTQVSLGSGYKMPAGVAIDVVGKVYVADYLNSAVKQLTPVGGFYLGNALPAGLIFNGATGVISGKPTTVTAPVNYSVTAYTASGGTTGVVNIKIVGNADLASLKLSTGTLAPVFASGSTSYTASVIYGATAITLTPVTTDPLATIKVNGITVTSGSPSGAIALSVGANVITTVVTGQDGTITKTYTVTVTRAPSYIATLYALKLSSGALTPVFGATTTSYTASVTNATASITITPTTTDTHATVKVNGTTVASGSPSGAIALSVGPNTITTIVTAQDGTTTKTYTVTVSRMGSTNIPDETVSVTNPLNKPQFTDDVVIVHQGVSPNGDGINDFLQIDGILAFPDNRLTIMNRNGLLVYEENGYDNSTRVFDGHSNKNGQMQLPGTYFFSLDYTKNGVVKHKTGFILLKY